MFVEGAVGIRSDSVFFVELCGIIAIGVGDGAAFSGLRSRLLGSISRNTYMIALPRAIQSIRLGIPLLRCL